MSEQVLYRKYRPKSFEEVVGQEHITGILEQAIKQGKIAHAYLFSGPRGTGKTTVARLLAKLANCPNQKNGAPCNKCEICLEFTSGHTLDLVEIDAASSRGIDEIRELREAVRLAPARATYKVYIIDEVHMLTKEAFNALLKTLEEPPAHAIFILATTELHKVPETIISRAQHFEFKKIRTEDIVERLSRILKKEEVKADKDALRLIALFAEGGLRDAESMLGQVLAGRSELSLEDVRLVLGAPKEEWVQALIAALAAKNAGEAMRVINTTVDEGTDPEFFLKIIIRQVRHLLLSVLNPKYLEEISSELSAEEKKFLQEQVKLFTIPELERMLKAFIDAYWASFRSIIPQIPLELAIVEILRDNLPETKSKE